MSSKLYSEPVQAGDDIGKTCSTKIKTAPISNQSSSYQSQSKPDTVLGVDVATLSRIREFFPFQIDILSEIVEIETKESDYGKMNTAKSTKHTVAELSDSDYFRSVHRRFDKSYRWVHLPGNDMYWFDVTISNEN